MTISSDETVVNSHASPYEIYDDPLFLSSSDQLNLQLLNYSLNGTNFINWKRDAYVALMAKNKEVFVDGTCKKPDKKDKKYHQWIRCDLLVMRWLLNCIVGGIKETLVYVNSSHELWNELLERYGQTNGLEIYQLKKDLHNITQENMPLIEYYSKLKHAWESIDSLDPLPTCSCGVLDSCSCQLLKKTLERESHSKLIQLLMGLNSGYESVKTTILSMEPLPPINKALALLQKIERQRQIADAVDVLTEANAYVSARQFDDQKSDAKKPKLDYLESDRGSKKCSHCQYTGHTKEECYKLKECTFCGKKGHVREICFKLKNGNGARHSNSKGKPGFAPGRNVYKRGANAADAMPLDHTELTPLGDSTIDSSSMPLVDADVMDGIVNNVMQQVLKAISDKTSAFNVNSFAGPFK